MMNLATKMRLQAQTARNADSILRATAKRDRERSTYPLLAEKLARAGYRSAGDEPAYLRFGRVPPGGRSSMKAFGLHEDGVSVLGGRFTRDGHFVFRIKNRRMHSEVVGLCEYENKAGYFVWGRYTGRGVDDEPLLGRVDRVEPVPDDCLVVAEGGSWALEKWNCLRMGGWPEDIPELAHLVQEAESD